MYQKYNQSYSNCLHVQLFTKLLLLLTVPLCETKTHINTIYLYPSIQTPFPLLSDVINEQPFNFEINLPLQMLGNFLLKYTKDGSLFTPYFLAYRWSFTLTKVMSKASASCDRTRFVKNSFLMMLLPLLVYIITRLDQSAISFK